LPAKLTNTIIEAAIYGFEAQKRALDAQIAELRAMLSDAPAEDATTTATGRPRRKMSAAARKKMAEGQRKRWAGAKGEVAREAPAAPKPRRKLSAAGRAAIVAATKKRWAAYRTAGKK
jgi:peptidoglycan hydrolase CwlO-like protein